jgi:hypothetical protein
MSFMTQTPHPRAKKGTFKSACRLPQLKSSHKEKCVDGGRKCAKFPNTTAAQHQTFRLSRLWEEVRDTRGRSTAYACKPKESNRHQQNNCTRTSRRVAHVVNDGQVYLIHRDENLRFPCPNLWQTFNATRPCEASQKT